jgi:hypothetical protein
VGRILTTSTQIGPRPKLAWLDLSLLVVDHNYQRDAIPKHVQAILAGFDWRYFQPPTVCPNGGGEYWVIDGQQRVLAAKLHPSLDKVPCYIINTPMTKEQADAFVRVNRERKNVNQVDMYWAGLAAEDEKYLAVRRVLESAGAEVSQTLGLASSKTTNAVGCLLLCVRTCGEDNTSLALQVLREARPNSNVLTSILIRSLATLFRNYEGISKRNMVTLLKEVDLLNIVSKAQLSRRVHGGSTASLLRAEFLDRYKAKYRRKDE